MFGGESPSCETQTTEIASPSFVGQEVTLDLNRKQVHW